MKHPISAVLCILAIIVGTQANLSPSFSFQGSTTGNLTDGTNVTTFTFTTYTIAIDVTRRLLALYAVGTLDGVAVTFSETVSINDGMAYTDVNGTCYAAPFVADTRYPFSYNENVWSVVFDNAVETPPGTYTVTSPPLTITLVTVSGSPTTLTYIYTEGSVTAITVVTFTNYSNETPPFSTFPLPAVCSQSTCASCYSSAIASTGSLFLQ